MVQSFWKIIQINDFLLTNHNNAEKGEIFIPKAPSANMLNIAKALIGKVKKDIVEVNSPKGIKIYTVVSVKYK